MPSILFIYLLIVNILSFGIMGHDKQLAKTKKRRVPEARLFFYAAIGGALGAWLGMRTYRHKTKHASFVYGIPALFVVNVACVYLLLQL
jgi:Predicted membrane protein